ncbi:DUF3347 domain-containing protein [Flavobacterium caeni]|uniref:DUF3347 domain-containing protein n=1 Tax=Flavobacterium caeni TaxID=490189 RepID=A0A1G5EMH5_9FLAO|nr:DUF3347 domain-containing protein [Flavobacterium caeni]SCY28179.1 Protein of unknown function [Flavobacterium caeni]
MKNLKKIILTAFLSIAFVTTYAVNSKNPFNSDLLIAQPVQENTMKEIYNAYFSIKDALVKSDGKTAAAKASELLRSISAVPMDKMKSEQHSVWMKVLPELKEDAAHISDTQDAKHQRDHFVTLSKNMHEVMKTFGTTDAVYYQKCPMANGGKGANWLSKEKAIKNPYYGNAMLTCGSTVETLK